MPFTQYLRRLFGQGSCRRYQTLHYPQNASKQGVTKTERVFSEPPSQKRATTSTAQAEKTDNDTATVTIAQGQSEALDLEPRVAIATPPKNISLNISATNNTAIEVFDIGPPYFAPTKPALEEIPTELVLIIANNLDPPTRGALALTSRALFIKSGGNDAVKFDEDDPQASQRHKLLLLLARDSRYLPLTLCPFCHIFHRPIRTSLPAGMTFNPEDARSANSKLQKCQRESPILNPSDYAAMAEYLPTKVHQSIVKAVLESYASVGSADLPKLRKLPLETDSYEVEVGDGETGATTLFCFNYDVAINNKEQILLKTQKTIIPCWHKTTSEKDTSAEEIVAAVERLGRILSDPNYEPHRHKLLNKLCEHKGENLTSRHITLFRGLLDRARFECIWTHPLNNSANCCPKSFEKMACVTKCRYCRTDIGIHIRDMELPGNNSFRTRKARAAVVTTWSDLGSRLPNSSWECHKTGWNILDPDTYPPPSEQRDWYIDPATVLLEFEREESTPLEEREQVLVKRYVNFEFRWPFHAEFWNSSDRGSQRRDDAEGIDGSITTIRAQDSEGFSLYYLPETHKMLELMVIRMRTSLNDYLNSIQ